MDCACIYVDEYDKPKFERTEIRKARKKHKCIECGREILPGEKYENVSGMWDTYMDVFKTCIDCLSIRRSFFCAGFLYEMMWEMLDEHITEMQGNISSKCLIPLTPNARKDVCELIEECWKEEEEEEEEANMENCGDICHF